MRWSFSRARGRPPARFLLNSVLVHGGVGVLAVLATLRAPEPLTFITFEVEIVSPPPSQDAPEEPAAAEELVVERPEEAPREETVDAVPLPDAKPKPEPERPQPEPEPREETPPTPTPQPEPAELSGEDIEIRMEGLRRDFPEYYQNIIRQIERCFRPPPGLPRGLTTTLDFIIRQDGTVTDLDFVQRSGNPDFDFEALGAVGDCAGRGRFGPLPDDFPWERLPIRFDFRPPGGDGTPVPSAS